MSQAIEALRTKLRAHRVYGMIDSVAALRLFMQSHVFAVWDFMSLVKSLQINVCGQRLPWVPPTNPQAARLLNEIMVGEESDSVGTGYKSHFELYCDAMREIGCSLTACDQLVAQARNLMPHQAYEDCLSGVGMPPACEDFIRDTFATLRHPVAVQAAVFFHARENIIPVMFRSMIDALVVQGLHCPILLDYLERHIHTDTEIHGPMAQRLLSELYGDSQLLRQAAEERALGALSARLALWDAIADRLSGQATASESRSMCQPIVLEQ